VIFTDSKEKLQKLWTIETWKIRRRRRRRIIKVCMIEKDLNVSLIFIVRRVFYFCDVFSLLVYTI
jgi:hypothetical protein